MAIFIAVTAALLACCTAIEITVNPSGIETPTESTITEYEAFRKKHRPDGDGEDHLSYKERFDIYQKRKQKVELHNANNLPWKAVINRFADYTDSEFNSLLGHRPSQKYGKRPLSNPASMMRVEPNPGKTTLIRDLVQTKDWRTSLQSVSFVKQQGYCGSCWAVAAIGALETHAEISRGSKKGAAQNISFKQIIDCTPNERHCGGEGGCKGATSELAFQYVQEHGVREFKEYGGQINIDEHCKPTAHLPAYMMSSGYRRLAENQYDDLFRTLATVGPVSVSVDAGNWSSYGSGIFMSCDRDAIVNHAVLAIGYGFDQPQGQPRMPYWLIRNSWGTDWGENGFLRLLRHEEKDIRQWDGTRGKDNPGYCGWDAKPQEGVGCDGGEAEIKVCGMCGVLSDSSYPLDVSTRD